MMARTIQFTLALIHLILYLINPTDSFKLSCEESDTGTLEFVQIVNRHGDRTAEFPSYPTDPLLNVQIGTVGKGQLTKIGKQQAFRFGKYLRSRYAGYLSPIYSALQVRAEASDVDRTIMTAQSILAGLFPPSRCDPESEWSNIIENWQPIPVHSIDNTIDNKIKVLSNCGKFVQSAFKVWNSEANHRFLDSYELFFNLLEKYGGVKFGHNRTSENLFLLRMYDNMLVQQRHGYKLPSWTEIYPDFWDIVVSIITHFFFDSYSEEEAKRLSAGPLLNQISTRMVEKVSSPPVIPGSKTVTLPKVLFYSGHDITIVPLLSALDLLKNETELPDYTAALIFELHRSNANGHVVKLFYRRQPDSIPEELSIPGCKGQCSLNQFEKLASKYYISDEDWFRECKVQN